MACDDTTTLASAVRRARGGRREQRRFKAVSALVESGDISSEDFAKSKSLSQYAVNGSGTLTCRMPARAVEPHPGVAPESARAHPGDDQKRHEERFIQQLKEQEAENKRCCTEVIESREARRKARLYWEHSKARLQSGPPKRFKITWMRVARFGETVGCSACAECYGDNLHPHRAKALHSNECRLRFWKLLMAQELIPAALPCPGNNEASGDDAKYECIPNCAMKVFASTATCKASVLPVVVACDPPSKMPEAKMRPITNNRPTVRSLNGADHLDGCVRLRTAVPEQPHGGDGCERNQRRKQVKTWSKKPKAADEVACDPPTNENAEITYDPALGEIACDPPDDSTVPNDFGVISPPPACDYRSPPGLSLSRHASPNEEGVYNDDPIDVMKEGGAAVNYTRKDDTLMKQRTEETPAAATASASPAALGVQIIDNMNKEFSAFREAKAQNDTLLVQFQQQNAKMMEMLTKMANDGTIPEPLPAPCRPPVDIIHRSPMPANEAACGPPPGMAASGMQVMVRRGDPTAAAAASVHQSSFSTSLPANRSNERGVEVACDPTGPDNKVGGEVACDHPVHSSSNCVAQDVSLEGKEQRTTAGMFIYSGPAEVACDPQVLESCASASITGPPMVVSAHAHPSPAMISQTTKAPSVEETSIQKAQVSPIIPFSTNNGVKQANILPIMPLSTNNEANVSPIIKKTKKQANVSPITKIQAKVSPITDNADFSVNKGKGKGSGGRISGFSSEYAGKSRNQPTKYFCMTDEQMQHQRQQQQQHPTVCSELRLKAGGGIIAQGPCEVTIRGKTKTRLCTLRNNPKTVFLVGNKRSYCTKDIGYIAVPGGFQICNPDRNERLLFSCGEDASAWHEAWVLMPCRSKRNRLQDTDSSSDEEVRKKLAWLDGSE